MDQNIQRALNDKLYDKRKVGALEYVFSFLAIDLFFCSRHSSPTLLLWHLQTDARLAGDGGRDKAGPFRT